MTKTKKAVIVSPNFYPAIGGAETQALLIGKELLKRGYGVSVVTRRYYPESGSLQHYEGIDIYRFSGILLKIIPVLFQLKSADIIIWNGLFSRINTLEIAFQAILCLLAKPFFKKTIFRIPCITSPITKNNFTKNLFLFSVDKWITINRGQYADLKSSGVPGEKLIAPPNLLIRTELFHQKRPFRINKKPVILFCGRTVDLKGLKTLIDSLMYLPKNSFKLVLLLSLPIKYPQECLRNLKILNNLSFPIEIKFDEINIESYFSTADIGVFPSLQEGGGNVLREMMAAGIATISSNIPAVREVVTDQKNGLIFHPSDPKDLAAKIMLLLKDANLRKIIGTNAKKMAEEVGNREIIISKFLE